MIVKLVRYEVRAEAVPKALEAVRAFVDEVKRKEGGTARYEAFQHTDPPTRFTHVMAFRTPSAEQYHQKTAWCKHFVETVYPLCTQTPEFSSISPVE